MTTYARTETRTAPLASEFGYNYAVRLFGEVALADLPRYQRGDFKGQLKGYLRWTRATSGGWCQDTRSVVRANELVRAWIGSDQLSLPGAALRGNWLGRVQQLCGVGYMLGDENRARETARYEQEVERLKAEAQHVVNQQRQMIADLRTQRRDAPAHQLPIIDQLIAQLEAQIAATENNAAN
jgi:hypothetical protein